MPTNNRYKTILTLADEDFSVYTAESPVTNLGDLVANNSTATAKDDGDGDIYCRMEITADSLGNPAADIDWLIQDAGLTYDGLRTRFRVRIGEHGLGESEFNNEAYVIKVGPMQIILTTGRTAAGLAGAANDTFTAHLAPRGFVGEDVAFSVTPLRGEWMDVEAAYASGNKQMEARLTTSAGSSKLKLTNLAIPATINRSSNEISTTIQRNGQTSGGTPSTTLDIDEVLIDKVQVGRGN